MSRRFRGRKAPAPEFSADLPSDADPTPLYDDPDAQALFGAAPPPTDRKTLQLCKQVARTLSCVLGGELGDDVLLGLLVDTVEPAPDASRLCVTVVATAPGASEAALREHLARARGQLRAAVAQSIHRKRVPELTFLVVVPPPRGEEVES
jgi:ribosome-binding factor A